MKRCIYSILIFLMLLCFVIPPSLGAATSTRAPFDYLDEEEQAYVGSMRGAIATARGLVQTARADLGTVFLQGYLDFEKRFPGELAAANDAIAVIKSISAPASFSDVAAQAQSILFFNVNNISDMLSPENPGGLIDVARSVGNIEGDFVDVDKELTSLLSALEQQVAKVAEAQRLGEEAINQLLSCDETQTS